MTDMPEQVSRLICLVETAARGAVDMTPEAILKIGTFLQYLAISELAVNIVILITSIIIMIFTWRKTRDSYNGYGKENTFNKTEFPAFLIPAVFFIIAFGFAVNNFPSRSTIVSTVSPETALMMTIHDTVTVRPRNTR